MTKYFRVVPADDEDAITIDIVSHHDYSFTQGERFDDAFAGPVEFEVDQELGGTRNPTLLFPEPVVKAEFVAALRAAGVANLVDYEAVIAGVRPGERVPGYRAINIVGVVACADLARSEYTSLEGMTFFDKLVIDPARTQGADLFRLAEAHEYVLVSETLVARLDLSPFPDVLLLPVES